MRNSRIERMYRYKKMTANQRAVAFVVLLAMLFALPMWSMAEDLSIGDTTVDVTSTGEPQKAFDKITITAGDVEVDTNYADFSIFMDLANDEYENPDKNGFFEPYENFLDKGGKKDTDFTKPEDYNAYLNEQSDDVLAPTWAQCTFKGVAVEGGTQSGTLNTKVNGSSVYVGQWNLTSDVGGNAVFRVDMAKQLYNPSYENAEVRFKIKLTSTSNIVGEGQPNLDFNESSNEIEITWPKEMRKTTEYKVEKTAASTTVDDLNMEFMISASGITTYKDDSSQTVATMNGITIRDTVTQGRADLLVTEAAVSTDGGVTFQVIPKEEYTYSTVSGIFSYRVPTLSADESDLIKKVNVRLKMELTEEAYYNNFIRDQKKEVTYKNKASLYKPGDAEVNKAVSNEVEVKVNFPFFEKEGKAVGLSNKFDWSIKANTRFWGYTTVQAFVVDSIEKWDTMHMYVTDGGISSISSGGNTVSQSIVEVSGNIPYSALTIGSIVAMLEENSISDKDDKWLLYTYKDGTTSVAAMIIPVSKYVNSDLEIKYQTEMAKKAPGSGASQKLENNARILWEMEFAGEGGPGYVVTSGAIVSVKKDVIAKYDLMSKVPGTDKYDPVKREIGWDFEINRYGAEMTDINIVDALEDKKQRYVDEIAMGESILLRVYNRATGQQSRTIKIPAKIDGENQNQYYTTEAGITSNGATTILKVHFNKIEADEVYKFSVKTMVWDMNILAKQGNSEVTNQATISAIIGGTTVTQKPVIAKKTISNTLITKAPVGGYDYNEHLVKWKVTINPNKLPITSGGGIEGAVVTDTLPIGSSFGSTIVAVRISGIDKTSTQAGIVDMDAGTITFNSVVGDANFPTEIVITMSDIILEGSREQKVFTFDRATADTYEFTFDTVFNEEYRTKTLLSNKKDVKIINDCQLKGQVGSNTFDYANVNVAAQATNTLNVKPLAKTGTMNGDPQNYKGAVYTYADGTTQAGMFWINWTVEFNRTSEDTEGHTLVDSLSSQFEMDSQSIKIWDGTTNSLNGNITPGKQLDVKDLMAKKQLVCYTTGFALNISEELSNKPLKITFNTFVVDTVSGANMKNKLSVFGANQDGMESEKANKSFDFKIDDYIKVSIVPYINIMKTSVETTYDDENKPNLKLEGAEFTLTPFDYEDGKGFSEDIVSEKIKLTGNNGQVTFRSLKTNKLYELEETKAPLGYKRPVEKQYIIFNPDESMGTIVRQTYPKAQIIEFEGVEGNFWNPTIKNTPGVGEETDPSIPPDPSTTEPAINTTVGSIQFTKTTDDGKPLAGAKFELSMESVKARSIAEKKTATSDATGKVFFTGLAPGTYKIVEVGSINGFKTLNGSLTAKVDFDGTAQLFHTTITDNGTNALTGDSTLGYALKNQYERGTIKLEKLEQGTATLLSGAEFEVLKDGNLVAYLTEDLTNKGSYVLSDTNGAGDGVSSAVNQWGSPYVSKQGSEFKLLVGEYKIKESKTPVDFVEIREDGRPNIGATGAALKTYTVTVSKDAETALSVENIFAGGKITGYKYNDATTPAGLKGANIGIFLPSTATHSALYTYMGLTAVSDETGLFTFTQIPYGEYLLAEISAPSGYQLNKNTISVEVTRGAVNVTKDINGKDIYITNAAIPSSGGGGGGGGVKPPVVPPINPVIPPVDPVTPPTDPVTPPITPPVTPPVTPTEPPIAKPSEPTILPGGEIFIPIPPESVRPGETEFEINKDGENVGKITIDNNGNLPFPSLERGNYELVNMDNGDTIEFFIEDEQVPLGGINFLDEDLIGNTPKTGVNPYTDLIATTIMLLSAMGIAVILYRKKQYK